MFPAVSFSATERKPAVVVGLTQASIVIAEVSDSEVELGIATDAFVPLNESAFPNLPAPAPAHVAFVIVPVFALPDWSVTVVPVPSSKPYAATRPVGGPFGTTALASDDGGPVLPALSSAVTL